MLRRQSDSRWRGRLTVAVGLVAVLGCCSAASRTAYARYAARRAGALGWSRESQVIPTRRCGRSCIVMGSRGVHARREKQQIDTSGRVPGDLLHIDVKTYSRFDAPGHAITGDRSRPGARKRKHLGQDYAHAAVDDHSRLAFSELYPDERSDSVLAFVEHALAFYRSHGITIRRILTDNAWSYTRNRALTELRAREGIQHKTIRPYRARTNGKVERFHQTMAREWGYGLSYASSRHRAQALPHWIEHYNQRRPHSGIGNRPPISRVHNLRGQDT